MPPVVLWDHLQDPLDVDKKKLKLEYAREADPNGTIQETEGEYHPDSQTSVTKPKEDQNRQLESSLIEIREIDKISLDDKEANETDENNNMYITQSAEQKNIQTYDPAILKEKITGQEGEFKFRHAMTSKDLGEIFAATNKNLALIKSGSISPRDARATIAMITSPSPADIMEESPQKSTKKMNPRELFQIKESLEYVSIGDLKAQFEEQQRNIQNDLANLKNPNLIKQQQEDNYGTQPSRKGQSRLQNNETPAKILDTQPTYYSQSIVSQEEHLNTVLGLETLNDLQISQIRQILNQKQDLVDWQNQQTQQTIDQEELELQRKLDQIQIRKKNMQNIQQEQMMNTNKQINPKDFDSQQQFYKTNGSATQGLIRTISNQGAQYYVPPSQLNESSKLRTQSFKIPPLSKQLTQNPQMNTSNKLKLNHQMTFNAKRQTVLQPGQSKLTMNSPGQQQEAVTDYQEQPSSTIFIQQNANPVEQALVSENLAFFDRAQEQEEVQRINSKSRRASKMTEKIVFKEPIADRKKMSSTQQVFQSIKAGHGLNVGGALARDSSGHNDQSQNGKSQMRNQEQPDDVKSNAYLSVGSNLSPGVKKLGGIARRKFARQSTRQQAEFKRTFSVRDSNGLLQPNQRSRDNSKGSKENVANENIKDIQNVIKSQEQLQEKMISKMSSKIVVDNQINRLQASFVNTETQNQTVVPDDQEIQDGKNRAQQSQQFEMKRMMDSQNIIAPSQRKVDSEEAARISAETPDNVIATQTDMENAKLKLKIRRSKKSFQGQVYLENSNDFLKSQLASLQANTITSRKLSTQNTKEKLREMQQLEEEKQRLMKESYDRKQGEINDNLKMIQQLEKELAEARQPKVAQTMAVQTSSRTLPQMSKQPSEKQLKKGMVNASITAYAENPKNELNPLLMSLQKSDQQEVQQLKDQANDPKTRDQNTNAMARDMATDPMICEKATDPRMQDIATDAWKRDGVMQTSHKSHINSLKNSLQNKQVIDSIRNSNVLVDADFDHNQQRITQSNLTQKEKDKENKKSSTKNNGSTQYNLDQGINDIMESRQKLHKSTDDQILSKAKIDEQLSKSLKDDINGTKLDSQNSGLEALNLESPSMNPKGHLKTSASPQDQNTDDQATRSRQEVEVDRTPIYHDHLLEEVMNQKVINLRNIQIKSRDQQRNDSRSTQQMFENQFAVRGKNKFKQKRNTQFSTAQHTPSQPHGQLQIINQSINQNNLPPINNGGKDQFNQAMNNMNAIAEQSNYDSFITPKAYNGHQQQPTMLRNQHSLISHHLPPNQPIQAFNMIQQPPPFDHPVSHSPNHMNQLSPSSHHRTKDNCMECAERRAKRKNHKQYQTLDQRNNQMELSNDRINGLPNPANSPHQHISNQMSYGQNGFGSRNHSLPPVMNNQIPQQNGQFNQQQQFVDYNQNQNSSYRNLNQQNMMMDPNMQQNYQSHHNSGMNSNRNLHAQQNYNFSNPPTGRAHGDQQFQANFTPNSVESSLPQIQMTQQQIPQHIIEQQQNGKPTYGFMKPETNKNSHPLKHFKGQDLEMYYMEKQLKPEVEKEIKKGFFEIRKKFGKDEIPDAKLVQTARGGKLTQKNKDDEEVQVYVSHICLHDFHPIFCKMNMDTVKIILQFSSIIYLNKGQTLFAPGFNDQFFYIILFGKCKLNNQNTGQQFGQQMNIGWTVGEEILFKAELSPSKDSSGKKTKIQRKEICKAVADSCFLGIEKRNLTQIKKSLYERGLQEEFTKIEIVLRGNHMVKKDWK